MKLLSWNKCLSEKLCYKNLFFFNAGGFSKRLYVYTSLRLYRLAHATQLVAFTFLYNMHAQ